MPPDGARVRRSSELQGVRRARLVCARADVDEPGVDRCLDSHGRPELSFGSGMSWLCPSYTLSLPRRGIVDLDAIDTSTQSLWGTEIGDRTGDGLPELFGSEGIWLSPITLGPDGFRPAGLVGLDEETPWIWPASFDVDGDALLDWLVVVQTDNAGPASYALALATGANGPTEVDVLGIGVPSDSPEVVTWADGGVARVLVKDGSVWRVAELGTAY